MLLKGIFLVNIKKLEGKMLKRLIKKLYFSAVKHKTARYKKLWLLALRYSLRHKNTSVIR